MASGNSCWGIEVGAGGVKAVRLERDGAGVRLEDYAVIPHKKPLSTPDTDPGDALRVGLGTLVSQADMKGASVSVSVPGHMGFTRFAKLPPVEPKKVPDIVKFEAVQQIPFPIEQVEWDYQTFVSEDSPDVEVGIFAITRERVMDRLALLADVKLNPIVVSLSPVSVYNALAYDLSFTNSTPGTVILDIGNVSTDLIVADAGRVWIRTFPIGGHHFTEALVSAFKVPYLKAEKLKREVEQSQHKRQIFQAMKPAFDDLANDVQRSIQYYSQLHPEAKLIRLVGLGASFQLPGLRKFLTQRLGLDVVRLDSFVRIAVDDARGAEFAAVSHQLATAYGCALQGLGLAPIDANLVPVSVVREAMWKKKTAWFAAAAALSVVGAGVSVVGAMTAGSGVATAKQAAQRKVSEVKRESDRLKQSWTEISGGARLGHSVANLLSLTEHRGIAGQLLQDVSAILGSADPQPELLGMATPSLPPGEWRLLELRSFTTEGLNTDIASATPSAATPGRGGRGGRGGAASGGGFGSSGGEGESSAPKVTCRLVVDASNAAQLRFINETVVRWLTANQKREGVPYTIIPPEPSAISREASRAEGGPGGGGEPTLDAMAPLPAIGAVFPEGADVQRYTIIWTIEILPAGETAPGASS